MTVWNSGEFWKIIQSYTRDVQLFGSQNGVLSLWRMFLTYYCKSIIFLKTTTTLYYFKLQIFYRATEKHSDEKLTLDIPDGFYNIHKHVKKVLATPRRYIALINLYITLYSEKKRIILQRQSKLQVNIYFSIYMYVLCKIVWTMYNYYNIILIIKCVIFVDTIFL